MDNLEQMIRNKALNLGYLDCGMVPVRRAMEGYEQYLDARYEHFPDDRQFKASNNYRMARPWEEYPWARAVVIATIPIGDYRLPETYRHRIGRIYAFDYRHEVTSEEYGWENEMADYMESLGLRVAHDPDRGVVPLRHVAQKAGIGIIRHNNFLYTKEHGSFVMMNAWLVDQPLELIRENRQKACPPDCHRCRDACPTGSLEASYTMHRRTCVSPLTNKYPEGADITQDDIGLRFDGWLYGCDACQEACPFNQPILKKAPVRDFPRQEEFAPYIDPEILLSLEDSFLEEHFQPRFWYMPKGSTWKWKANAMCALITEKNPKAKELIMPYLDHPDENLQKTASWALKHI